MENNKVYKTKVKEFLGYDVRTVRVDNEHEYKQKGRPSHAGWGAAFVFFMI